MKKEKGFTLIELMIVISIIALLAAVALPKFSTATNDAKVANVRSSLASLRTSIQMYNARYQAYPTGPGGANATFIGGANVSPNIQASLGRFFAPNPASPNTTGVYDKNVLPDTPVGTNVTGVAATGAGSHAIVAVAAATAFNAGNNVTPAGTAAGAGGTPGGWCYKAANGEIHPNLLNGDRTAGVGGAYDAFINWAQE